jgi:hypothetical protein
VSSTLNALGFARDGRSCESTVRYVFGLIWPHACIDCDLGEDCLLVGVNDGTHRHVVTIPRSMLELDQGLALVRAVYRAGLPNEFCNAPAGLWRSL